MKQLIHEKVNQKTTPEAVILFSNLIVICLSDEQAGSSSSDNLLLGELREELGLDNNGDGDLSVSEELEDSGSDEVDNGGLSLGGGLGGLVGSLGGEVEHPVNIGNIAELAVLQEVVVPHSDLSEVSRVILVHHDPVVVLSSSVTTSSGVTTVLSDTSLSGGDVSALLAVL